MDPISVPCPPELAFDSDLRRLWGNLTSADLSFLERPSEPGVVDSRNFVASLLRASYGAGYARALSEENAREFAREHGIVE